MSEYRSQRIQNLLREQISVMIMRGVIKDPRVSPMLSITHITVSKDYAYADVYVSSLEDQARLLKSVAALNHAAGFIQHKLNGSLRLRSTPILRFKSDSAIKDGYDMMKKLENL